MKEVTLFIMSNKGFRVLDSIIRNSYDDIISKVIYAEDNMVIEDYSKEIKELCKSNNIICYSRKENLEIATEYLIAISWRWIIKVKSNQTLIVLHDSLLPKYRGFSPLVTALQNNDKEIGVTALLASNEYDKGDILRQSSIKIEYPIKIEEAIKKITVCYVDIVLHLLESIIKKYPIIGIRQDEKKASYSLWRNEEDYLIDWNWDANYIKTFVDSVGFPYKGALTNNLNEKIRVIDVEVVEDLKIANRIPGKVILIEKEQPVIVCGRGLIKIKDAYYDFSQEKALPFKNFRTKLS